MNTPSTSLHARETKQHRPITALEEFRNANKSGGRFGRRFKTFCRLYTRQQLYEDLYLTEQPYGLVCGVETDLPAND
jgi:hypothetical protein